jgi:uncharacterized membrane-anchored protein
MNLTKYHPTFTEVFTAVTVVAPLALVVAAFCLSPDSMAEASIIVQGSKVIVAIMGAALALRAAYNLQFKFRATYMNEMPTSPFTVLSV